MNARLSPTLPEVTISESRGVRYLHLGTPWIQGAMRIAEPLDHRARLRPANDRLDALPRRSRGHRAATPSSSVWVPARSRGSAHKRLKTRTTAIELNPQVIAACRHWFRLPDDSD